MKKLEIAVAADIANYFQQCRIDLVEEDGDQNKYEIRGQLHISLNKDFPRVFEGHTFTVDEIISLRDMCDEVLKDV